jgi:hypothetical protein
MGAASLVLLSAMALLATPLISAAQESGKTPRVGYVRSGSFANDPYRAPFLRGMRDDSAFIANRRELATQATRHRLPLVCGFPELAKAGCLLSYAVSNVDAWYRLAAYVDKILKGARPGDLPVEQASKFELLINLKTAKASLKMLVMRRDGPQSLAPRQRLERLLPMAGFEVSIYGRIWVSTEVVALFLLLIPCTGVADDRLGV